MVVFAHDKARGLFLDKTTAAESDVQAWLASSSLWTSSHNPDVA
jgi:hypothetical protein